MRDSWEPGWHSRVSLNVTIRQLVSILYLIETCAGAIGSPREFDAYFRALSNAQVKGNVFDDLFRSITYDSQELKACANNNDGIIIVSCRSGGQRGEQGRGRRRIVAPACIACSHYASFR